MNLSAPEKKNKEKRNFWEHLILEGFLLLAWAVCCGHFLLAYVRSHGIPFDTYGKLALLTQAGILLVLLLLHGRKWKTNSLRQWMREHPVRILTYLMLLCAFLIFKDFIYGYKVFVFRDIGVDTTNQYIPTLFLMINKLKTGDLSFWEFNYGMGLDILNSQSQIFDPFNLIYYALGCFTGVHEVLYAVGLVQILKCLFCGWLAWLFLNEFSFSALAKVLASCVCAFSGFLMLWGQHYFFGTACVYVLLLIWLTEKALRNRKHLVWFTLAVAGALIFSIYVAYMIALAVIVYLFVRAAMRKEDLGENPVRIILQFVAAAVVAFLLSAVVSLPVYYQQSVVSSRLSEKQSLLKALVRLYSPGQYVSTILRFFSNNLQGIADNFVGHSNYYECIQLFFSALFLPFLVLFYAEGIGYNRRRRGVYLVTALLLAAAIFSPAGALVINLLVNTATRYTFVFLPVAAYVLASVLTRLHSFHRIPLLMAWAAAAGGLFLAVRHRADLGTDHMLQISLLLICTVVVLGMLIVTAASLFSGQQKRLLPADRISGKKESFSAGGFSGKLVSGMTLGLGALMLVSTVFDGNLTNASRQLWDPQSIYTNRAFFSGEDAVMTEAAKTDQEVFRVEKKYSDFSVWNDAILENYSGVSYYNTTYNKYVCQFVDEVWPEILWNFMYGGNYVLFTQDADNVQMASLLDIRYIYEDTNGEQNTLAEDPAYQKEGENTQNGTTRIENPGAEGLGIFFEKMMDEDEFLQLPREQRQPVLKDTLVLDSDPDQDPEPDETWKIGEQIDSDARETDPGSYQADAADYYKSHAVSVEKNGSDGNLTAEVETGKAGYLFVSIPYDSGWSAEVNGEKTEIQNADVGFQAVAVPAGKSTVTFRYTTPLMREGFLLALAGLVLYLAEILLVQKRVHKRR